LEGFSDAVFGFALTLLVVSLETPGDVGQVIELAKGFGPFALTFAMVSWIWYEHNLFFRRYGLQDAWTVFLNSVLLFVVLFYVYPLKFLASQLVGLMVMLIAGADAVATRPNFGTTLFEQRWLMLIYSGGIVLIFLSFVLLYRHAWRKRRELDLSPRDETELVLVQRSHMITLGLGLTSMLLVTINPRWAQWAGLVYMLMGPLHGWHGYRANARLEQMDRAAEAAAAGPPTTP
jgi:uncharacterized membrane protein